MKRIAFTIVLNGMPFIKQQAEIIPDIFDHWYIIEGYALPINDTAWCRNIDVSKFTNNGLSNDGTSEFIDTLPDNVTVIRKTSGDFWRGKTEMCNSFMHEISDCILMQFDVDEIWKRDTLIDLLNYAEINDDFDSMRFKCNCYVGPDLIISGDDCYGNRATEWHRLWRIRDTTYWVAHEPPLIYGDTKILDNNFTFKKNWIFDHYSYVYEHQVFFKQHYYGYTGAVNRWKELQQIKSFPVNTKDYLPWVDKMDTGKVIKK